MVEDVGGASWLFQANPKLFDVVGAVSQFEEMTWLVRQHATEIEAGDRVFIWRSGERAGVVAIAEVTQPVQMLTPDNLQSGFYLEPSKFAGLQPRVVIRIRAVINPPLARSLVRLHPDLADLTVLRAPQGTNFRLSPVQASTLAQLAVSVPNPKEVPSKRRNPDWIEEELILALDLYFRHRPSLPGKSAPEIAELSDTLNRLAETLHLAPGDDPTVEFSEGRLAEVLHRRRERNPAVAKGKKAQALKRHGRLQCEVCGFDFARVYGKDGEGFIEAHHLVPVSHWNPGERKTRLDEIALVCSNCHRMLHRVKPWPTVPELRLRVGSLGAIAIQ